MSSSERNSIEAEWSLYKNETIPDEWIKYTVDSTSDGSGIKFHRLDHYWRHLFEMRTESGAAKYPSLSTLVKMCLSIPHGNAAVERSLSINKNLLGDKRSALHPDTMKGLRYAKDAIAFHDPVEKRPEKVPISKQFIKVVRSSRASYEVYREDENKKKAEKQKQKDANEETRKAYDDARKKVSDTESKLVKLREVEQTVLESIKVSQNVVQNAQVQLEMGIKEQNIVVVRAANEMLKVGNCKMETDLQQSTTLRRRISELESRKRCASESVMKLLLSLSTDEYSSLSSTGVE